MIVIEENAFLILERRLNRIESLILNMSEGGNKLSAKKGNTSRRQNQKKTLHTSEGTVNAPQQKGGSSDQ